MSEEKMRNLRNELDEAAAAGDFLTFVLVKAEQLEGIHRLAASRDPKYIGRELLEDAQMMRAAHLALWQMREVLGYPIPNAIDEMYPAQLDGNGGSNPFKCGMCEARKKFPEAHARQIAEQAGGMFIPSDKFGDKQ